MFWKQLAALTVLTAISSMALTNPVLKRTADLGQELEPPKHGKDPKDRSEILMRQANVSAEIDRRGMAIPALENENDDMEQSDENASPRTLLSARGGAEKGGEIMGKGCTKLCKCVDDKCTKCMKPCPSFYLCVAQVYTKCLSQSFECTHWKKKMKQFLDFTCATKLLLEKEEENLTMESDKDENKEHGLDESLQDKRSC